MTPERRRVFSKRGLNVKSYVQDGYRRGLDNHAYVYNYLVRGMNGGQRIQNCVGIVTGCASMPKYFCCQNQDRATA
jgi:hypothetical protein